MYVHVCSDNLVKFSLPVFCRARCYCSICYILLNSLLGFLSFFFFKVLVLVKPMWEMLTVQSDIILFIVGKMKLVLSDLICDS